MHDNDTDAKRRLQTRSKTRETKVHKKMAVHGRGMKRFAKPSKKG